MRTTFRGGLILGKGGKHMAEIQKDYPVKEYQGELHYEGNIVNSDIKSGDLSNPKSGKAINGVAIKGTNGAKFV